MVLVTFALWVAHSGTMMAVQGGMRADFSAATAGLAILALATIFASAASVPFRERLQR